MINLREEDKKYISQNKGNYSKRGAMDILLIIEKQYGLDKMKIVEEEMKNLGIDIKSFSKVSAIPLQSFITLLVVKKKVLDLSDEEVVLFGEEVARLSFLLKFASRLLASPEIICKNANVGWKKYYDAGKLIVKDFNKKEGKIIGEVDEFIGHPVHCRYMQGYFNKIMFFVVGRETSCREVECIFEGGDKHRYIMEWNPN